MTYNEFKQANAAGLKLYAEHGGKGYPKFKFRVKEVDFEHGICLINGEWQKIRDTLIAVMNKQICVMNPQVFRNWSKFDKEIVYYKDSDLNSPKNMVLFATAGFYTEDGVNDRLNGDSRGVVIKETNARYDYFNSMIQMDYDDLCTIMGNGSVGTVLVIMKIKTWQGIRYGYKLINPTDWRDILGVYGCDDYAFYVDRYNLLFKGYHHDSDGVPNEGLIRVVKPDMKLTDACMDKIMKAYAAGEAGALLSRYTTSLRPVIEEAHGL